MEVSSECKADNNNTNSNAITTSKSNTSSTTSLQALKLNTSQPGSHPVIFPHEILAQLRQSAILFRNVTLIGHVAGESPPIKEIEAWVNAYLVNPTLHPEIEISQVAGLSQSYFTITFTSKEGADKAFTLSPVDCDRHLMFLHAWTPNFNPPPEEAALLWVLFPELPRIYYPYMEYIANTIGRVVWQSEKSTNVRKGLPPKIRILVDDVRLLPGSVSLPLAATDGWFEQRVSYEGMSNQICRKCKNLTIATDLDNDA